MGVLLRWPRSKHGLFLSVKPQYTPGSSSPSGLVAQEKVARFWNVYKPNSRAPPIIPSPLISCYPGGHCSPLGLFAEARVHFELSADRILQDVDKSFNSPSCLISGTEVAVIGDTDFWRHQSNSHTIDPISVANFVAFSSPAHHEWSYQYWIQSIVHGPKFVRHLW
ncbi:hypothetical protein DL93DRAFT_2096159 [Clavulina sp. PMI_390]|nr:hypothetical protein DL93DRAFT_2096159 [Clavulina sp. PMI_390]